MAPMAPTARTLLRAAGIGAALALVGVAVVYLIARAVGDPLSVTSGGRSGQVPLVIALLLTLVGAVVGFLLALVVRRLRRPRTVFLAVTIVALVLYAFAPFSAADQTSTAVWLNVLHLVAAAGILPLLARALPRERTASTAAEPALA